MGEVERALAIGGTFHAYGKLRDLVAFGWAEKKAMQGKGWTVYRLTESGRVVVALHCGDKGAPAR